MSFAVAAAGTGGHVYPGLAVGEALVNLGIDRSRVLFIGGSRLESTVYPDAGFPFLAVELRGLQRRFTTANLGIPRVVVNATRAIRAELRARRVESLLGLGGYVTLPAAWAARRERIPYLISEQNAHAGLANRVMAPGARRVFGSFPDTVGLSGATWVGNPVRERLARFERSSLRPLALERWDLDPDVPVLGVFGGSLGAGAVNTAVASMLEDWTGPDIQVLHLAGHGHAAMGERAAMSPRRWIVLEFVEEMELFYAAVDLVVARAGGSVAELTVTSTPSVLIPGGFGSGGHQVANASALESVGASTVLPEDQLDRLGGTVAGILSSPRRRREMAEACRQLARPDAAADIARAMVEVTEA